MGFEKSLQKTAYILFIIVVLGYLLKVGSAILLPVIYAIFLSLFLVGIDRRVVKYVRIRWLSIIITFLIVILPVVLVFTIFSVQLGTIFASLPSITDSVKTGVEKVVLFIDNQLPYLELNYENLVKENINTIVEAPLGFLQKGISSSTSVLLGIAMCFIYTFFILLYRKSFQDYVVYQFKDSVHFDIHETLTKIKETVEGYVGGLGIVMIVLCVLNTLGLWLIGIQYPFFWGSLGAVLAIIPYIGTMLGGMLPFLYSLATSDFLWQPVAVVIYYIVIQQIEGNLITPKIVGEKVDINPLFAIFSLIFFAFFWGIGGVILALPIISTIKILLSQIESTKALSVLMSSSIDAEEKLLRLYDRRERSINRMRKRKK